MPDSRASDSDRCYACFQHVGVEDERDEARAEVARLREALDRIAATRPSDVGPGDVPVLSAWDAVRVAREALDARP